MLKCLILSIESINQNFDQEFFFQIYICIYNVYIHCIFIFQTDSA
jgi:hypothetical protein